MAHAAVLSRLALFQLLPAVPKPDEEPPTEEEIRAKMVAVSFGQHVGPLYRTPPDFPTDNN